MEQKHALKKSIGCTYNFIGPGPGGDGGVLLLLLLDKTLGVSVASAAVLSLLLSMVVVEGAGEDGEGACSAVDVVTEAASSFASVLTTDAECGT